MAPLSRTEQQKNLRQVLGKMADNLRGKIDGWDFKAYVLGTMFYRFISEDLTRYLNEQERAAGNPDFDYAELDDEVAELGRDETVQEKGYFILPSELFQNVMAKSKDEDNLDDLNEIMSTAFQNIEDSAKGTASESDFAGLFDELDVNATKLGSTVTERNGRLAQVLQTIGELNLGNFEDNTIDLFGDSYEVLMGLYASQAGKAGGEYFTPQEVSEVLTRITLVDKDKVHRVYDPACGSGSLLLKFAKFLDEDNQPDGFYGQESNPSTHSLARINMFLHGIPFEKFDIAHGDTLINPLHGDIEPFDAIVSNPPYSTPWVGKDDVTLINDPRFAPAGALAPKKYSDYAFIMHMLSWLAENGTAAIVSFPGIMYRLGDEKKIRQYLVEKNFVEAVINLPPNIFYGTNISTCILVLKKSKETEDVLFVNAAKLFQKEGKDCFLLPEHQDAIVKGYANREDVEYFSKVVTNKEIAENDFFLTVNSYVEKEDDGEITDIVEVNARLTEIVAEQVELRALVDEFVAELEEAASFTEAGDDE